MMLKRFLAFYIDNFLATMLISPVIIKMTIEGKTTLNILLVGLGGIVMLGFHLIKDALNLSLGKHLFKLVVYQYGSGQKATKKQLILRNVTLFFWPLEAIVAALSSDHRRLGDKIAKTMVDVDRSKPLYK